MEKLTIYNNEPQEDEIVNCVPTDIDKNFGTVNYILPDYCDKNGDKLKAIMMFKQATRHTKINKIPWKKFSEIGKTYQAMIINISHDTYELSMIKLEQNKDRFNEFIDKDKKIYILKELILSISKTKNININDLLDNIIYPLNNSRIETKSNKNLYEYVKDNINFNDYKYNFSQEEINKYINKLNKTNNKINNKITTNFRFVSPQGLEILKQIFRNSLEKYNQNDITIKRNCHDQWYLESNTSTISNDDHNNIMNIIKTLSRENKCSFKQI